MNKQALPVIDIAPLFLESDEAIDAVAEQIDTACREWGFFYITGHGIDPKIIQAIIAKGQAFFNQSLEEKLQIDIRESANHRGYGVEGAEQLDEDSPGDRKETFDMALSLPADDPDVKAGIPLYGPNQYPEVENFQQTFEEHYQRMLKLGVTLLNALARALKQPDHFFDSYFSKPISVLRMIHYPPILPGTQLPFLSAGKHTDYGCLTLLWQDNTGGLQVQNVDGDWIDAPPIENSFVINIGDMMARWSNGRYKSTAHRVEQRTTGSRYSMPFFLEPNFKSEIGCLPGCYGEGNPCQYDTVVAGEWLMSRFAATYSYRDEK